MGNVNIFKLSIVPKAIYRLKAISTKIPLEFFHRIRTNSFKICMEPQKNS